MNDKENLNDTERKALANLSQEKAPPEFLEENIVSELKSKNLITKNEVHSTTPLLHYVSLAIAAVVIFALGMKLGEMKEIIPTAEIVSVDSRQFMLLLYETEGEFQQAPEGGEAEVIAEYISWARSVAQTGVTIDGEKLTSKGHSLLGIGFDASVNSIAPVLGERLLAGYFAIEADNFEQALKISEDCPHLKYGGEIELREVQLTSSDTPESLSQ